jgi:hypothetical protein
MAEQEKKTKKKRTFGSILRWIGLNLISVLVILALFFRAPWKVIVLLIIILAACTILPRPYRKWFWLSVAAVVLVLIIWIFLPDDNVGWRPYTFDDAFAALEAKYAIPDSENAATIYNQLLQDYNDAEFYGNLSKEARRKLPVREPWVGQEHPELADWIKSHESTITKLKQAAAIKKCHFTITHPQDEKRMRRGGMVRRWAFLLITSANNDLAEGRTDEALKKLVTTLEMGKHLSQQPTMIDMLVGMAIEAFAVGHFKSFIVDRDATEQRLTVIEDALAGVKHDWTSYWPKIIDSQKLLTKNLLCGVAYQVNPQGKVRVSRDPVAPLRAQVEAVLRKEAPPLTYGRRKLLKATAIFTWFYIPSTPQRAARAIDNCYKRYYAMADPDFDWEKGPRRFSTLSTMMSVGFNYRYLAERTVRMSEPSLYRIHVIYFRVAAGNHGSRIMVALRRYKNKHGRWPQTLDDIKALVPEEILVDPINGGSFVYKLTEENFTLYSKGKNNIDEGGERNQSGADDWLIWPPKIRKTTKEEKANDQQQ